MFSKSKRFSLKGTLDSEMATLSAMRVTDPVRSKSFLKRGDDLIQLAATGQLRKFIEHVDAADDGDIFFYFIVKMLHSALINGHLMIATFIVDQGYPLQSSTIPNALIDAINIVDDSLAISIIEFLVLANGMDVNSQGKPSWFTPLHIAVKRGLGQTVAFLLLHGADVNAVADGDCMPLTLAENLKLSVPGRDFIIETLLKSGAKKSWRKDGKISSSSVPGSIRGNFVTFSSGDSRNSSGTLNYPKQNSMVSFHSGSEPNRIFKNQSNVTATVTLTPFDTVYGPALNPSGNIIGWHQNSSNKDIIGAHTSSSIPVINLSDILCGNLSPIIDDMSVADIHDKKEIEINKKIANLELIPGNSNEILFSDNMYHSVLADNGRLFPIAEPKELPIVRTNCNFSSNLFHSRDRNIGTSNNGILDNMLCGVKVGDRTNDVEDENVRCPYHLSDDGALVFSTN